jgi:recombinational DNA repair protein RecR
MAGETKKQLCMICAKPSEKSICANCADRVRGEALEKKKKVEKPEK